MRLTVRVGELVVHVDELTILVGEFTILVDEFTILVDEFTILVDVFTIHVHQYMSVSGFLSSSRALALVSSSFVRSGVSTGWQASAC